MGKSMNEAMEASFQIEADAEASSLEELEAMYDDLSVRFKACINGHADLGPLLCYDRIWTFYVPG